MAPIQGFVRLRKHQLGKQSAIGTPVAATRIFPYRGNLGINLNWTDPDVDVGSIDPVLAPYRSGSEITESLTGPLQYNDIPTFFAAGLIGSVTPTGGGAAKTWTHTAQSTTSTAFDYFTDEWGDDVTADGAQAFGGIVERIQLGFGADMGAWTATSDWRFVNVNRPVAPTGGLSVSSNSGVFVYGTDTSFWVNDTAGAIGTTQIIDAVHGFQQTITNTIDVKRFANGSNAVGRFGISGFGLSARAINTEITFAKTTESIAEVAKWFNASAQDRFIEVRNISPDIITGSTPFSFNIKTAGRWYTRTDGEENGNTTIVLGCNSFYDATGLTYAYRGTTVNTRSAL